MPIKEDTAMQQQILHELEFTAQVPLSDTRRLGGASGYYYVARITLTNNRRNVYNLHCGRVGEFRSMTALSLHHDYTVTGWLDALQQSHECTTIWVDRNNGYLANTVQVEDLAKYL